MFIHIPVSPYVPLMTPTPATGIFQQVKVGEPASGIAPLGETVKVCEWENPEHIRMNRTMILFNKFFM